MLTILTRVAGVVTVLGLLYGRSGATRCSKSSTAYDRAEWKAKYSRPTSVPFPAENQFTPERELVGRMLFFDARLSSSKSISCATCHNPGLSWGDGLPKAIGQAKKTLGRRTPTILNVAWADLLFWDGRAGSLEEQVLVPLTSPEEMDRTPELAAQRVADIPGYKRMFASAYPGQPISGKTLGLAIATFERTIVSGTSPFDLWIAGREDALSESAKRGFDIFNRNAGCQKCHDGWNFTDNGFHDIGTGDQDPGRWSRLPLEAMRHAFKTPTLRNVAERGPYMHDGSERTLADVIDLYDRGGRMKRPSLAPEVHRLHLSAAAKTDLIEFLKTLTSDDRRLKVPVLPGPEVSEMKHER
jgi:cytochrome c peroxidase